MFDLSSRRTCFEAALGVADWLEVDSSATETNTGGTTTLDLLRRGGATGAGSDDVVEDSAFACDKEVVARSIDLLTLWIWGLRLVDSIPPSAAGDETRQQVIDNDVYCIQML